MSDPLTDFLNQLFGQGPYAAQPAQTAPAPMERMGQSPTKPQISPSMRRTPSRSNAPLPPKRPVELGGQSTPLPPSRPAGLGDGMGGPGATPPSTLPSSVPPTSNSPQPGAPSLDPSRFLASQGVGQPSPGALAALGAAGAGAMPVTSAPSMPPSWGGNILPTMSIPAAGPPAPLQGWAPPQAPAPVTAPSDPSASIQALLRLKQQLPPVAIGSPASNNVQAGLLGGF